MNSAAPAPTSSGTSDPGARPPLRIAVFAYVVNPRSPAGNCQLQLVQALCREHEFTVFSTEFQNPCPERIRWVKVPAPRRPLALLYAFFHLSALVRYWVYRLQHRGGFDLIQMEGPAMMMGDISYAHFCNRAFLKHHWGESRPQGLRGVLRWLDHRLQSFFEPKVFRRVRRVVAPSQGLARELRSEYPFTSAKLQVLPNPVDTERMRRPASFDREGFRCGQGIGPEDLLLAFVALGHYERKGLPLLLEALAQLPDPHLKLVVVGGPPDLVGGYQARAVKMGLQGRVRFVGMQSDVRPYLWAAEAFVFPSSYEAFPLAALEAAAAGLPLIASPISGVDEFLRDGCNGLSIERSVQGVARGIERFAASSPDRRRSMGEQARRDVQAFDGKNFADSWRAFYGGMNVG